MILPIAKVCPLIRNLSVAFAGIFLASWIGSSQVAAQPKIEITDPKVPAGTVFLTQGAVDLTVTVKGDDVTRLRAFVTQINEAKEVIDSAKQEFKVDPDKREQSITVNVFKGPNIVRLIALKGEKGEPDTSISASVTVTCSGKKCGAVTMSGTEGDDQAKPKPPKPGGNINILQPTAPNVVNGLISSLITVKKSPIQRVFIQVINDGKTVEQPKSLISVKYADELALLTPKLKVGKGKNIITVFDPDQPVETTDKTSTTVTCDGPKCDSPDIAKDTSGIRIETPEGGAKLKEEEVDSKITVEKKSGIEHVFILVLNNGKQVKQDKTTIDVGDFGDKTQVALTPKIKIGKGKNIITVFDADKSLEDSPQDSTEVSCDTCEAAAKESTSEITIDEPKNGKEYETSFRDAYLTVAKDSKIKKIKYYVIQDGKTVVNAAEVEAVDVTPPEKEGDPGKATVPIKFVKGVNEVVFFDVDDPLNTEHQAKLTVTCKGPKCATDFQIATITTNSQFTRVVVGMEQAGASSASSETKPFLDFFFTTPFLFDTMKDEVVLVRRLDANGVPVFVNGLQVWDRVQRPLPGPDGNPIKVPRFGAWGQVRFSTTPQQTATAAVFPSNFVNQVTDSTKVVDLVQSFDYMAGLEYRLFRANGTIFTLIPGIKQRTHVYLTFGAGAISPLTAKRESAQIFRIPAAAVPAVGTTPAIPASPQRDQFVGTFGVPPTDKTYIGFVPLERDRFFRQYYFGVRFKTHYCEDEVCLRFMNRFPSIVDFGFGQNEAVTGGRLFYDVRDASNTIIGKKRSWVLRVDAYFPLPFREASFLYLYGTALMKIGAGGVQITNPLFLDTAPGDVLITSPSVFIPPPEKQPSQLNRDYYKIGIGVNLTDLFNRNKTPPQ